MSAPKMMPALLGGLFIGVLSSLPYIKGGNVCCCLWVISGGALAAWVMQQNTPRPVTLGEGAVVGLLSGVVGTVVWIAWGVIGLLVFASSPFDMADFQRAMGEAEGMTPEAREALESLSPAVMLVVGGVIWAFVSMAFATLGGLLGAMLFRRKGGPGVPTPGTPGAGPVNPTFAPPTFTPPAPVVPPPFMPPPPTPPPPAAPLGSLAPPRRCRRPRPTSTRHRCRRRPPRSPPWRLRRLPHRRAGRPRHRAAGRRHRTTPTSATRRRS